MASPLNPSASSFSNQILFFTLANFYDLGSKNVHACRASLLSTIAYGAGGRRYLRRLLQAKHLIHFDDPPDLEHLSESVLPYPDPVLSVMAALESGPFPLQKVVDPSISVPIAVYLEFRHLFNFKLRRSAETYRLHPTPLKSLLLNDSAVFHNKPTQYVHTKVNVYLTDVYKSALTHYRSACPSLNALLISVMGLPLSNDHVSAMVMMYCLLYSKVGERVARVCFAIMTHMPACKKLNQLVKSLGIAINPHFELFAEWSTLFGRSVDAFDMWGDLLHRVDLKASQNHVATFDPDQLRRAVRRVYSDEIQNLPSYPTLDDYWRRRYVMRANGAHSRFVHTQPDIVKVPDDVPGRLTKKLFYELQHKNPISPDRRPFTRAAFSTKLEHGKVRALYACDSLSTLYFDALLSPLERVWSNSHVLLSPGSMSFEDLHARLGNDGLTYSAIDADDFNSQHSIQAMKIVFEELPVPESHEWLRDWCVASFDNLSIVIEGNTLKWVSSLPSGHRATTFINSVLNAAYIRCAIDDVYDTLDVAYHTGDDIILGSTSRNAIHTITSRILASPLRANPTKLTFGRAEFLRHTYSRTSVTGYLARRVSSVVSGNWVTETMLSPAERLTSMYQSAWSMAARSHDRFAGLLLHESVARFCNLPLSVAYDVCYLNVAPSGCPVLASDRSTYGKITIPQPPNASLKTPLHVKYHAASGDFLESLGRFEIIRETGLTPGQIVTQFAEKSFSKYYRQRSALGSGVDGYVAEPPRVNHYTVPSATANLSQEDYDSTLERYSEAKLDPLCQAIKSLCDPHTFTAFYIAYTGSTLIDSVAKSTCPYLLGFTSITLASTANLRSQMSGKHLAWVPKVHIYT
nr:MAG: RNA-dependent RNA polymerase [Tuatara cloaca-associated totivirus-1]UUV42632.1 MAG: RNA-dependent RNA polymerase [Tuatara cloaca-associated totivirus-1]